MVSFVSIARSKIYEKLQADAGLCCSVLGWVPGIITMVLCAVLFWITSITMHKFIMKYPQIMDICELSNLPLEWHSLQHLLIECSGQVTSATMCSERVVRPMCSLHLCCWRITSF